MVKVEDRQGEGPRGDSQANGLLGHPQKLLDVAEAALVLKVSKATLYGWVHVRKIPHRKHGRRLVFCYYDVLAWSEEQKVVCGASNSLSLPGIDGKARADCHRCGGSLKTRQSVEASNRTTEVCRGDY